MYPEFDVALKFTAMYLIHILILSNKSKYYYTTAL